MDSFILKVIASHYNRVEFFLKHSQTTSKEWNNKNTQLFLKQNKNIVSITATYDLTRVMFKDEEKDDQLDEDKEDDISFGLRVCSERDN
ncbi:hypothetical protein JTE90_011531 [Oedothorax gibbosus]|uniref:Uncharacterized protein n=1 Tax=Oedothorax gibbosus TaxID=931172 RepID=A0AAV6UK25_9ARAC|nr:hypothetical protein JTE90_011531 [Oedothorax gibbosus]